MTEKGTMKNTSIDDQLREARMLRARACKTCAHWFQSQAAAEYCGPGECRIRAPLLIQTIDIVGEPTAYRRLAKEPIAGGKRQLRKQCAKCGELFGQALKRELLVQIRQRSNTSKEWNEERNDEIREAGKRFIARQHEQQRQWWRDYDAYLETDEWRRKRELVFQRARGMCEGCREREAKQVHHLTYNNVFDEFLWQLVAV